MGNETRRLLHSDHPCRGCGSTSMKYDGTDVAHDEAACIRSQGIRLYLGVPVGTPVLAVPELIIERCIVVRSTTTPWINYHVVKDPGRPDRREYSLDTRDLFEVLPPENADSEALERWLAEDWSAPANAHGHRLDAV